MRRHALAGLAAAAVVAGLPALSASQTPVSAAPAATPAATLTATARNIGTLGTTSSATAIDGPIVVGDSNKNASVVHAFAYDLNTSTMRDLGTLGGTISHAVAVDDDIVVGQALTAGRSQHAFAYDLRTSTMRDLGTLGGSSSTATDVDGGLVVGNSFTTEGGQHAFAYDLTTGTMRDLGTLGGRESAAIAVSSGVVTGTSVTATGESHAYAADLRLPTTTLRDLGTLGGDNSVAFGIDANTVTGRSATASGSAHVFAHDLTTGAMRDLGTLGGRYGAPAAVRAGVVVGQSVTAAGFGHAFAVEPGGASMRDLGGLGGYSSHANDVAGRLVVGSAVRAGDYQTRPFVYDLGATRPVMTDLGTLGGTTGEAVAIDGNVAVGRSRTAGVSLRATIWTIRSTTAPAFHFGAVRYAVRESGRRATVTVVRSGRTAPAASVRYATSSADAVAGRDFRAMSGTLRFASGQTRRTFSVPVLDDPRRERDETILLTLRSPSRGAVLGTPNAAGLVIRASDQRPDGWVSTRASSGFAGNNVYNGNGRRQTRTLTARRTQTRTFHVRVYNDGNATNTFVVRGTAARAGSTVRYFDGTTDVTDALRSRVGLRLSLAPRGYKALTVRLTPTRSAAAGSLKPAAVTATWRGDGTRSDTVRAVARVVR